MTKLTVICNDEIRAREILETARMDTAAEACVVTVFRAMWSSAAVTGLDMDLTDALRSLVSQKILRTRRSAGGGRHYEIRL